MAPNRFALLALLYAAIIAYASTVIGPAGLNYVANDFAIVAERFAQQATTWVEHGSDQRSDWMGNLLMMAGLGFLVRGGFRGRNAVPAAGAFVLCLLLILSMKFAQLWFPPRTVTLNYIVAQGTGALFGILLFPLTHGRLAAIARGYAGGPLHSLTMLLQIYAAILVLLMLMPLDFAVSAADLAAQWERLPVVLTAITGDGRPRLVQAVLIVASIVSLMPVGMLLTITTKGRTSIGRSVTGATGLGFLLMVAVLVLSALVISAAPSLVAVAYRTLGIGLGAWLMHYLSRGDIARLRHWLAVAVPFLVLPYAIMLFAVNGLVSRHWIGPAAAWDNLYMLGLLPLFDYYIVTKAEAAKNIVAHAAMYAPAGVMVWLRAEHRARPGLAAWLGGGLSLVVEIGRYLRPGLEGDINAVAVAAIAAWGAAKLMPAAWWMLEGIARPRLPNVPPSGLGWRERAAATRALSETGARPTGKIERY